MQNLVIFSSFFGMYHGRIIILEVSRLFNSYFPSIRNLFCLEKRLNSKQKKKILLVGMRKVKSLLFYLVIALSSNFFCTTMIHSKLKGRNSRNMDIKMNSNNRVTEKKEIVVVDEFQLQNIKSSLRCNLGRKRSI